ncbi:hypothetical protein [Staphylococcus canis]|uniref:XRE family transcriptional regulator n=1 Tax=Staphylococcus canis TaxID=2724942 RepID=A0ABS0T9R3_9STAP|nr:hypothetical protein [Staphylococcus canis]MBI5974518.1 hypothetical protein [Staphylococcus canis]
MNMIEKITMLVYGNHGLSFRELQRRSGISHSTFAHIKKGDRKITGLTIGTGMRLSKLYDELERAGKLKKDDELIRQHSDQ